jgi:DNA-binding LytR/AlgR family response regulator
MDIYLGGISGMDTARKIRETDPNCLLIFITVSSDHALDAFSVRANSYLVKPLNAEKMETALTACIQTFVKNSRMIELCADHQKFQLPLANVQYVEVYGKTTLFHSGTGVFKAYISLDEIEKILCGEPFLRCHRCYIVNMNYVEDVREQDFLMRNGDSVPMRKNGRRDVKLAMARFMVHSNFMDESP